MVVVDDRDLTSDDDRPNAKLSCHLYNGRTRWSAEGQFLRVRLFKKAPRERRERKPSRQRKNLKQKLSVIQIRIFGLIQIRMSVGSVPKCCGCITLSALVISPSMV